MPGFPKRDPSTYPRWQYSKRSSKRIDALTLKSGRIRWIGRRPQHALEFVEQSHMRFAVSQEPATLFDHLVGAIENGQRNLQAKRLGGLEIDHEFKLGGLLHR